MDLRSDAFLAGRPDASAVIFDNLLYDRKPDAAAALGRISRRIRPVETVENIRQIFRRDSLSVVLDDDLDVLVTAFSSFLSMFWRRPDGTIWSLIPCMLEYVVLYGLMESYTAGSPRHSYHSELCCGYAMVMGAALCGYAVSLILHIALWQLFASMIILVCRFMVVVVVIGAKKEA